MQKQSAPRCQSLSQGSPSTVMSFRHFFSKIHQFLSFRSVKQVGPINLLVLLLVIFVSSLGWLAVGAQTESNSDEASSTRAFLPIVVNSTGNTASDLQQESESDTPSTEPEVELVMAAAATNYVVNTTIDELDGTCIAAPGDCSLRDAAALAAASPLDFDTITLPAGNYVLSLGAITLGTVQLQGASASTTMIDGNFANRVFLVNSGTVVIANVTVINGRRSGQSGANIRHTSGRLTIENSRIVDGLILSGSGFCGGGIFSQSAVSASLANPSLIVRNSEVVGNQNSGGNGGGLCVMQGVATIINSQINGNLASLKGGGIFVNSGVTVALSTTAPLSKTVVSSNLVNNDGGGIFINTNGIVTVDHGIISSNQALNGAGIAVSTGAKLTLSNFVEIKDNLASANGGGLYNLSAGANLNIASTTLIEGNAANIDNTASGCGGGIYSQISGAGTLTLNGFTLRNNQSLPENPAPSNQVVGSGGGICVASSNLTINGLRVENNIASQRGGGIYSTGGTLTCTGNSAINANRSSNDGGGIFIANATTLTMNNCALNDNEALNGGAIAVDASGAATINNSLLNNNSAQANGGGIANLSTNVTIDNTDITGNLANSDRTPTGDGGGVYSGEINAQGAGGAITIRNSLIHGNQTFGNHGGGVAIVKHTATIQNTLIDNNTTSLRGGGLYLAGGTLNLSGSTVRGNFASNDGGGLYLRGAIFSAEAGIVTINTSTIHNNSGLNGGGIAADNNGQITVANSTISSNEGQSSGGGVHSQASSVVLHQATIVSNIADADATGTGTGGGVASAAGGDIQLKNTLIANNLRVAVADDCAGNVTSQRNNLIETTSGCTIGGDLTGNLTGVDPQLGALSNNGGPTLTHLPAAGSPVIDAVPVGNCVMTADQRGVGRPQGAGCEIGAVEVGE